MAQKIKQMVVAHVILVVSGLKWLIFWEQIGVRKHLTESHLFLESDLLVVLFEEVPAILGVPEACFNVNIHLTGRVVLVVSGGYDHIEINTRFS